MGKLVLAVVMILGGATMAFGTAEKSGADKKAQAIIRKKCVGCHGEDRINAAFKAGRDMRAVRVSMEKRGVKLSDQEKTTLDFYWKQTPVLKK